MRDCDNVTVRERLPDLLHGGLAGDARSEVERHVASCAECARELELLRAVRASLPAPEVDVERIVASLPAYRRSRSALSWPSWPIRAAAAILLVAGAAALWTLSRREPRASGPAPVASRRESTTVVGATPTPPRPVVAQLSLGEPIADLSDNDLRDLADVVSGLDAVTSEEIDNPITSFPEGDS